MTGVRLRSVEGGKPAPEAVPPAEVVPLRGRPVTAPSEAVAMAERPPPMLSRVTLYLVAALIVALVAWAALSQVDRVVAAQGRLVTTVPNLVVQPLETSVIRSIEARAGDMVRAGQVLATLDPTFAASDVAQVSTRLAARAAQVARLEAEIDGRPFTAPPGADAEMRLQAANFAQRASFRDARIAEFEARIASSRAAIETNRRDQEGAAARLEVLRELEAMRQQLVAGHVGSRVALLETRSTRIDLESRLDNLRARIAELTQDMHRAEAERRAFVEDQRQQMFEELTRMRADRDQAQEELAKAELRRNMVVLAAPTDAVVLEVAQRSVGSVVREAEALFTLVPADAPLEAELNIAPADIGRLALDQRVRIKLDAFPYQEHGVIDGRLRSISEGAFPIGRENSGETAYRGRTALGPVQLRGVPAGIRLMPGMTLSGEIQVGSRNLLAYFAYPFLRGLDESLREP